MTQRIPKFSVDRYVHSMTGVMNNQLVWYCHIPDAERPDEPIEVVRGRVTGLGEKGRKRFDIRANDSDVVLHADAALVFTFWTELAARRCAREMWLMRYLETKDKLKALGVARYFHDTDARIRVLERTADLERNSERTRSLAQQMAPARPPGCEICGHDLDQHGFCDDPDCRGHKVQTGKLADWRMGK